MFRTQSRRKSHFATGFETLELIFHVTIRNLRKTHGNAVLGLVLSIVQSVVLVGIMYMMFSLLGVSRVAVRGDFLLFVMSGVFMFTIHISALGAVSRAEGPTSPMMMHAPMNPIISISGAALASLYTHTLSAAIILFLYHAIFSPISFEDPVGMLGLYLLSWISGAGIGMVLLSARPWQPDLVSIVTSVFMRANMIASGKMLVANNTPPALRAWFDWNPLFHVIDQGRGYIFLNYTPRVTSISYAIYVTLFCVVIGLMTEFFTRQYASASWEKRR
jgi:ABC-type polysaccharide/polyol phosphate export permease